MTRKQKIQRNRMAAKCYHETMKQHPELKLVAWGRVSKQRRRWVMQVGREGFVAALTAQVLTDGFHAFNDKGIAGVTLSDLYKVTEGLTRNSTVP